MKTQILLLSLTTALLLGCSSTGSKKPASAKGGDNNEPKSWFCEGA
jgi:outer membrane biogenesis lipoprotein LolB